MKLLTFSNKQSGFSIVFRQQGRKSISSETCWETFAIIQGKGDGRSSRNGKTDVVVSLKAKTKGVPKVLVEFVSQRQESDDLEIFGPNI